MVGVPGKSKGCNTCRRRKKGCDQGQPSCGQCIRAGLECEGYGRNLIWVNAVTNPSHSGVSFPRETTRGRVNELGQRVSTLSRRVPVIANRQLTITLHESLTRTAREQKYLGLFWAAYLPNGLAFSTPASRYSTGGWTGLLRGFFDTEPSLRLAVLASSTAMLGAQNEDAQLLLKGLQTYSSAVREISTALQDPRRRISDGFFAAVRMLEFYEVTFGSDSGNWPSEASLQHHRHKSVFESWRGHNDGLLAVFVLRGPKSFRREPSHQLFVDNRLNPIVGAIMARRRSPLSAPEWKSVPWGSRAKTPKDKLLDILADMPGLLEDAEKARHCTSLLEAQHLQLELLRQCRECDRAVGVWEADMGDRLAVYDYTASGLPMHPPKTDQDLALIHLTNLYWAICIMLYRTMSLLLRGMLQSPIPESSTTSAGSAGPTAASSAKPSSSEHITDYEKALARSFDPRWYAYKIARSMPLFFLPSTGAFGSNVGLFPLGVALHVLAAVEPPEQPSTERQILIDCFRQPHMGSYVGRFLTKMQDASSEERYKGLR